MTIALTGEQQVTERKQSSKEFKLDAISLVLELGYTRAEAVKSLEINLAHWGAG